MWFAGTDAELLARQFSIGVLASLGAVCGCQRVVDAQLLSVRSSGFLTSWFDWSSAWRLHLSHLLRIPSWLFVLVGLVATSFCLLIVVVAKLLTIAIQSDVASRLAATYHIEWC